MLERVCDLNTGAAVSRRMGPANIHALIPATWEHGTPPDGRELKDVTRLRIWRGGDYSALSGGPSETTGVLRGRRQEKTPRSLRNLHGTELSGEHLGHWALPPQLPTSTLPQGLRTGLRDLLQKWTALLCDAA